MEDLRFNKIREYLSSRGASLFSRFLFEIPQFKNLKDEYTMIIALSDKSIENISEFLNKKIEEFPNSQEAISIMGNHISILPTNRSYPMFTSITGVKYGETINDITKLKAKEPTKIDGVSIVIIDEVIISKDQRKQSERVVDLDARNQKKRYPMVPIKFYGTPTASLGKGSFGQVDKYVLKDSKGNTVKEYAIKTFLHSGQEIPVDAMREIAILRRIKHPNIIELLGLVSIDENDLNSKIQIVLEYADGNLANYIKDTYNYSSIFSVEITKSYMYQLSRGLLYLHDNDIVHRDIKPHNILIFKDGRVAIADFGIARAGFIEGRTYTLNVQTLWWRAPEILFGANSYGKNADVFSLGVVFIDLWLGFYVFGFDKIEDIQRKQISLLGNMTEDEWPGISGFKNYSEGMRIFASTRHNGKLEKEFAASNTGKQADPDTIELIRNMTIPNPANRSSIRQIIESNYFNKNISQGNSNTTLGIVEKAYPVIDKGPFVCGNNLNGAQLLENDIINIPRFKIPIPDKNYIITTGWLLEVMAHFGFSNVTFMHSRLLFGYYLNSKAKSIVGGKTPIANSNLQAIGITCLMISAKLLDLYSPGLRQYSMITDGTFSEESLAKTERDIVKTVNFDLYFPTPSDYIAYVLKNDIPVIKLASALANLICILPDEIKTRELGYVTSYLAFEFYHGEEGLKLPECIYEVDEKGLGIDHIKQVSNSYIKRISELSKTINEDILRYINRTRDLKDIIKSWGNQHKHKLLPLADLSSTSSEYGFNSDVNLLNNEFNTSLELSERSIETFKSLDIEIDRAAISTFAKRMIINFAARFIQSQDVKKGIESKFANYFKLKKDIAGNYYILEPLTSNIEISIGSPKEKFINLKVNLSQIPPSLDQIILEFINKIPSGEWMVYRELEGRFV